jgi:hypothetical protein
VALSAESMSLAPVRDASGNERGRVSPVGEHMVEERLGEKPRVRRLHRCRIRC